MKAALLVMAGGAIGSLLRYLTAYISRDFNALNFPIATFSVNMIGSFLIGIFYAAFMNSPSAEHVRLFVIIGLLGGFTTFSSYTLELVQMGGQKQWLLAGAYIILSNVLGFAAAFAGAFVVEAWKG